MAKPDQRQPRRLRRIFRWCVVLAFIGILTIFFAGLYLNRVGVPDFLKRPLLAKLRAKGIQVDFDRMRLRWYRGIVVDKVTFTFLKQPLQPKFSSAEAEINLNYRSLLDTDLKLNSLTIKQGNLIWPASKTNHFALSNITTHVRFGANQRIAVEQFQADFIGTRINITGALTNVSALRDWKIFQPKKPGRPKLGLQQLAAALEKIHISGEPKLTLNLSGDAADPESVQGELNFSAAVANTPWGSGINLHLSAQLHDYLDPAQNNFIRLRTDSANTPWGSASRLNCFVRLTSVSTNHDSFQTEVRLSARQLRSEYGRIDSVRFNGQTSQAWTNVVPIRAVGNCHRDQCGIQMGQSGGGRNFLCGGDQYDSEIGG